MERARIEDLVASQFTSERLMPLQSIYFAISAGVVMAFTVGCILGMQSTGETVPSFASILAYTSMVAPVLMFLLSNKLFDQKMGDLDGTGDMFGQVRGALIAKAAIVEGGALIGGVAWWLICLETHISNIPPAYYGVFFSLLVMLFNTANYLPTPDRVRWWLHSKGA